MLICFPITCRFTSGWLMNSSYRKIVDISTKVKQVRVGKMKYLDKHTNSMLIYHTYQRAVLKRGIQTVTKQEKQKVV